MMFSDSNGGGGGGRLGSRGNGSSGYEGSERRMVDITRDKPIKVAVRVQVPVRDHPKVIHSFYFFMSLTASDLDKFTRRFDFAREEKIFNKVFIKVGIVFLYYRLNH